MTDMLPKMKIKRETFIRRLRVALYRPFLLTFREPVIMLLALYLTLIYIVLFLPRWVRLHLRRNPWNKVRYHRAMLPRHHSWTFRSYGTCPSHLQVGEKRFEEDPRGGGTRLPPEFRLWFSMLGGALAIPISLFWMGWTSYSWISIWSPLDASVLFGYGILCVFISSYQYIIDSYESYSASALASVTLIRYVAAGAMAVVGILFYENMGVHWTLTILGGISALLVPVPYLFYMYGKQIKGKSKYAVAKD